MTNGIQRLFPAALLLLARVGVPLLAALTASSAVTLGQQELGDEKVVPRIRKTIPPDGAHGVSVDRSTVIVFSTRIRPETVTPQAISVTADSSPLFADIRVSMDKRVVVLTYPPAGLPPDAVMEVTIVGDLILGRDGFAVDADGDGAPGGTLVFSFDTKWDPPMDSGTATVIGNVFDVDGSPLQGATIDAVLYPGNDHEPPNHPVLSGADGSFSYETDPFVGTESWLVRIRNGEGYSESLRAVTIMVDRCWRVDDAFLQPVQAKTDVAAGEEATLVDDTGQVTLYIPPGALQGDSAIGITILQGHKFLRDELPPNVVTTFDDGMTGSFAGTFIDVSGVFGEETDFPVTLTLPLEFDAPVGTPVVMGKIDHNTLEWTDIRYAGDAADESFVGTVIDVGGDKFIEIQFTHFCTLCTPYCLDLEGPDGEIHHIHGPAPASELCCEFDYVALAAVPDTHGSHGPHANDVGGPGYVTESSVVGLREGHLYEFIELPAFREFGRPAGLTLGYYSGAAHPSVSLTASAVYPGNRPVERTKFEFQIEGISRFGIYDFSENQSPISSWIWNGTDGSGQLLPTGSYTYRTAIECLHADAKVFLPDPATGEFGDPGSLGPFGSYPGLSVLRSAEVERRAVLVNLQASPYGAGWSVMNEHRLYFDPDGCVILLDGNANWGRFDPDPAVPYTWISPAGDFSTLTMDPGSGELFRSFDDGTLHHYDAQGRIQSAADRNGLLWSYAYDPSGLLSSIATPTGFVWAFGYDVDDRLESIQDSAGRLTSFTVDGNGDLVAVTDAEGSTRSFTYDADHLLISQTGPQGERSEYDYVGGRVVEARAYDVGGSGLLRRRTYEPSVLNGEIGQAEAAGLGTDVLNPIPLVTDRIDRWTDGRGFVRLHESSPEGWTMSETDPLGRSVQWNYIGGLLAERIRSNGSRTEFDNVVGSTTSVRELTESGVLYSEETMEYEGPFGGLSAFTDGENSTWSYGYDVLGNVTSITDPSLGVMILVYGDPTHPHLPSRVITAAGGVVDITYDAHGNKASVTDYPDPIGDPDGRTVSLSYDAAGNPTDVFDGPGNHMQLGWDGLGRQTSLTDAEGHVTQILYDDTSQGGCGCSTGNVTKVVFPDLEEILYDYDGLGRPVARTDQALQVTTYQYDAEGNLLEHTDRNGDVVTHQYDAAGQLVRRELPGDVTVFEYDDLGLLETAQDARCRLELDYDFLGRFVAERTTLEVEVGDDSVVPLEYALAYAYDRASDRESMTDSNGLASFEYVHDAQHRLTHVYPTGLPSAGWLQAYDADGRITSIERQVPGFSSTFAYDPGGQLESIVHGTAQPLALLYTAYGDTGNLDAADYEYPAESVAEEFEYDSNLRLTNATTGARVGDARVDATYTIGSADRLTSDGEYAYTYDAEGRLVQRTDASGARREVFVYNADGELLEYREEVDVGAGFAPVQLTRYAYDPRGRRVEKVTNGVAERYVYEDQNLLHVLDGENRVELTFVHADDLDRPLAMIDRVTGMQHELLADRLGSIVGMADANGDLVQERLFDEYGNELRNSEPRYPSIKGFTGRDFDLETGLYQYRFRTYDPVVGRFLSEDPADLSGGLNLYEYTNGNPVNWVDPLGLRPSRLQYNGNAQRDCCLRSLFEQCMGERGAIAKFMEGTTATLGIVGGCAGGAKAGSFFGPWGTLFGCLIGGGGAAIASNWFAAPVIDVFRCPSCATEANVAIRDYDF